MSKWSTFPLATQAFCQVLLTVYASSTDKGIRQDATSFSWALNYIFTTPPPRLYSPVPVQESTGADHRRRGANPAILLRSDPRLCRWKPLLGQCHGGEAWRRRRSFTSDHPLRVEAVEYGRMLLIFFMACQDTCTCTRLAPRRREGGVFIPEIFPGNVRRARFLLRIDPLATRDGIALR